MKNYSIFPLLLIIICISAIVSGCTEIDDGNNKELSGTREKESRQIAENYVRNSDSYKTFNLTEPILIETRPLNCSSCWQFVYKFDLVSKKNPAVVKGEIIDAVYSQGSKY